MRTPIQIRRRRRHLLTGALAAALLAAPAAQAALPNPIWGRQPPEEPPVVVVESDGSFDWADAGIGAGTAVGVVLIGAAAGVRLSHRRRLVSS
jgi:hypothetical protein